ncbi:MAG: helix-turn-helix domain-containing protein [Chthonomonadales bacterium]|nr:helix-turn-helix domain-containing protein [Chthonomonadales bacterium]
MSNPIRRLRTERGLSVRHIANAVGCSSGHIYALERADAALTLPMARKLAAILDVPIQKLINGRPGPSKPGARRGRRRRSMKIGDIVEIAAGDFAGIRGVVDKPPDERPNPGQIGVRAIGPVGSGSYEPACVIHWEPEP